MKTRYIAIKRRQKVLNEKGEEVLAPVRLMVRVNNAIPPSHKLCEGNFRA